ncbi:cell cycle control protein Cwf15, putative [Talaromyces stipitatus ATCC 10500]|uniref:Cell cycle control protein Cwf15, putative n=1 Tax=Talaromyces stipitatus (strain ATCC 10500 / CBS 375.48 / QM 6759 / NRRL 1006) TaxID=441959 RepID=B8M2L7_TALSN|nr:cell cycle control protein Cwf15, putative [Talaromyces stipitatus ATCC 10500]EED21928.1 cell cycle control protein Cwf15, putative [Talaromyces stipitatus ATCC 10500]
MTTAHRPTFDPAQGKEALRGPAYHQRLLPAYMHLKTRQPGQGGAADQPRDLRAELLAAEAAHFAKTKGVTNESPAEPVPKLKRDLEEDREANLDAEDIEAKRRRILEETRDIDADSVGSDSDSSEEESDDEEDEAAELMRELEKIKQERQAQKEKEEREREAQEQEQREYDIARGNPLLNPQDFNIKRRWDDDVVFKNQARGSEVKKGPEFVNDLLRSDFHKRFMSSTMDSQATSKTLHNRINTDITQLLQRFENILAPSRVENSENANTAVGVYNLNVETTALIRAAEDLLSLTRYMKEAWLFEKLNTVGEDEHDKRRNQKLEEDVAGVREAVQRGLLGDNDTNGEGK